MLARVSRLGSLARARVEPKPFIFEFSAMSTPCVLQLYGVRENFARALSLEIKQNTLALEKKYSFYDPASFLNRHINARAQNKIRLDAQTLGLLKRVRELSARTNGAFDVSVGTYKHCYRCRTRAEFEACAGEFAGKTGASSWQLSGEYLEFAFLQTKLDLGGVVKEYAVDEAAQILAQSGVQSAIVNFGGDLYALGKSPRGDSFSIGVKNPKDPASHIVCVELQNMAMTTSAHYERGYEIEGKRFSHIIPSRLPSGAGASGGCASAGAGDNHAGALKGQGEQTKPSSAILSATAISQSALESGIYSTAFMLGGAFDIPAHVKIILIDESLRIHQNLLR